MPGTKEIRTKIKSVQNTRKITKAMEMVAASKMRKAQERMRHARPYGEKIRNVAAHISPRQPRVPPSVPGRARHGEAHRHHRRHHRQGPVRRRSTPTCCASRSTSTRSGRRRARRSRSARIGNKGLGFMQRLGANIVSHVVQLGDRPQMDKLIGAVKVMLDGYTADRFDRADDRLHALHQHDEAGAGDRAAAAAVGRAPGRAGDGAGTTSTSPTRKAVLDQVLTRYIEALIYQAVAENMASEQSARMVAMKAASRQRRDRDRRADADLQQDPPGGDHQGTVGDRRRRRRRLERIRIRKDSHGTSERRHHRPVHRRGDRHRVPARSDARASTTR